MNIKLVFASACAAVHVFGSTSAASAMYPCSEHKELSEKEYCEIRKHLLDQLKSPSGLWLYLHINFECPYEDTLALDLSCSVPIGQKSIDINSINPQDSSVEPKQVLDMLCKEAFQDDKVVFDLVKGIVEDVVDSPSVFDNIDTLVKFVGLLNGNCSCISVPKIFIDSESVLRWFVHLDFAISARRMFKLDKWTFQDLLVPKIILDDRLRRFNLKIISILDCEDWAHQCLLYFCEPQDFLQRMSDDILTRLVNFDFESKRSAIIVKNVVCKIEKYVELHENVPELCIFASPSVCIEIYEGARILCITNPSVILLHKHLFPALQTIINVQLQKTLDQEMAKLTMERTEGAVVAALEWMQWMVGMESAVQTSVYDNPYIHKRIYKALCETFAKYVAIKEALVMLDPYENLCLSKDSLSLPKFNSNCIVETFVKSRHDANGGDDKTMKILRGLLQQQ